MGETSVAIADDGALNYQDAGGKPRPTVRTRCTLNLTRLVVLAAEAHHDDSGLTWPVGMAPFAVHLIGLNLEDEAVRAQAEEIYARLRSAGVEVLFDDRDARAGEKFSDFDLFGIPIRLTVSKRMVKEGKVELKRRGEAESTLVSPEDALALAGEASAAPAGQAGAGAVTAPSCGSGNR